MMRSLWKGHLSVGLVTIPIKVYNGLDTTDEIHFNQIHRGCGGRAGQKLYCKKCEKDIDRSMITKGYQYTTDEYVLFENGEIEQIRLKSTKTIEIQGFVPISEIDPVSIEAPYYLAPDGNVAGAAYHLIAKTLRKTKLYGIGKIVLRHREDTVALAPAPNTSGLVIYKLRQSNEIRDFSDVPMIKEAAVDKSQLELAKTLIESMTTTMSKLDLVDRYREALADLVEAKISKHEIVIAPTTEKSTAPADIMTVLKASIESAKKRKEAA
jgi:DNA end-binding protein Ku